MVESNQKVLSLIGIRMKRRNARARLAMAMRDHIACAVKHRHGFRMFCVAAPHSVVQALKMKTDSGKALSQRIVHFMCQTLALAHNGCHLPTLETKIEVDSSADKK